MPGGSGEPGGPGGHGGPGVFGVPDGVYGVPAVACVERRSKMQGGGGPKRLTFNLDPSKLNVEFKVVILIA